jgi:hypothetical protein
LYDHTYEAPDGTHCTVSRMALPDLLHCLASGIEACNPDESTPGAVATVRMRLEIELLIRRLGL